MHGLSVVSAGMIRSPLKRLQPNPPQSGADEVIWEITPNERRAQHRLADEGASQIFEGCRVPQLKKFQCTRHGQDAGGYQSGS